MPSPAQELRGAAFRNGHVAEILAVRRCAAEVAGFYRFGGGRLWAEGALQVAAGNLFWLGESCPLNWDPSGRDEVAVQMIIGYLEAAWRLELVESGLLDSASWRSPKVDISDFTVFFPVCRPHGWGMPMVVRCEIRGLGVIGNAGGEKVVLH